MPPAFESLTAQLEAARNPNLDEPFLQRYMGTPRPVLGVKTDTLRRIARDTHRSLPAGAAGDGLWLDLLDSLYAGPFFDQRLLAGHLIHTRPAARKTLDLERLRAWLGPLLGWCEVDTTCQNGWSGGEVLGRWGEWEPFLTSLAYEERISLRRASLVLPLQSVRDSADERLLAHALDTISRRAHERDPLITKAISWLLRGLLRHHAAAVAAYLEQNASRLPAIAVRETRNKLATGKK